MNFRIPVNWEVHGIMEIEADNIEEAIFKAGDYPYPSIEGNVDGSQEVNFEMIEYFNPGVKVPSESALFYEKIVGKETEKVVFDSGTLRVTKKSLRS